MFLSAVLDRKRDPAARARLFEGLMKDSQRGAYNLALRLSGNVTDAEDIVQEAYLRAFRFFDRYDERLAFSSWLYRIVINSHIDLIRRRGRVKTTSLNAFADENGAAMEIPDLESSPDRHLMAVTLEAPLQQALQSISPEFRTAVLLADAQGLAYEEVAEIMGTSIGTVRSRIHRGRKQLKAHLTKNPHNLWARSNDEL